MNFSLYKDGRGEWRWRIYSANNSDILGDSGEGYKNKQDALHAIRVIKRDAANAGIWDAESKEWL